MDEDWTARTLKCAACGIYRHPEDMAIQWIGDNVYPLCHPGNSVGPTCYMTTPIERLTP